MRLVHFFFKEKTWLGCIHFAGTFIYSIAHYSGKSDQMYKHFFSFEISSSSTTIRIDKKQTKYAKYLISVSPETCQNSKRGENAGSHTNESFLTIGYF